jgi:hypothetical protein
MIKQKWVWVITCLTATVLLFQFCIQEKIPDSKDPRGIAYAGSESCGSCHAAIANSYSLTAHNKTTTPANAYNIKGKFHLDSNQYVYRTDLKVLMEEQDGSFFQTAYLNGEKNASYPFDIVIGSGRKAQTFLYWQGTNAFQLPVSYSVIGKCWVNSPNYPADNVRFDRIIPIGCFECHSSFIERTGMHEEKGYRVDELNKNTLIFGIDCERCHGPAAAHVAYQKENPLDKKAKYIHSFASINNIQQIETCATCHSGLKEPIRSPFLFRPGHTLKDFYKTDAVPQKVEELDVHGNQYQLLLASKCFKGSINTITCSSCHDPHQTERNNTKIFSTRCMSCHEQNTPSFCSFENKVGPTIVNNCIDCHMPATPSKLITLQTEKQSGEIANLVRSHLIANYPEATKQFLKSKQLSKFK